ncbi:hypothetical protein AB834_06795 [PVC group bacterium (ex Bugula neritina AB1)]|nr:hypothetical protein AB834_06795 [PVC group bacterium (ex Bugula neritina AB1)]
MKNVILEVKKRNEKGKKEVKNLRKEGLTPAVLYGTSGNEVISIDTVEFENVLSHSSSVGSLLFELKGGDLFDTRLTVVREIQEHPLTHKILNVDFQEISMKEKMVFTLPISLVGEEDATSLGGVLEQHMWEIKVRALPESVPSKYKVDISGMKMGEFLHVSDLPSDENVEVSEDAKELILAVVAPRKDSDDSAVEDEEVGAKEPEVTRQKAELKEETAD